MMSHDIWSLHRVTNHPSGHWISPLESGLDDISVELPDRVPLSLALDDALEQRASCRRFADEPLALNAVSTLLGAGYGCGPKVSVEGTEFASRPVPSAGAKYPLQLHLLIRSVSGLPPGAYRYVPEEHRLSPSGPGVASAALAELFLGQPYLIPAAAVVVLAGSLEKTAARYGDRAYRYVLFEAGHVAQNLSLAAAALEMGCLNLGGFLDDGLANVLRLDAGVAPLYGLALGKPAGSDRDDLRRIA